MNLEKYQIGANGQVAQIYTNLEQNLAINNGFNQKLYDLENTVGSSTGGKIIGGIVMIVGAILNPVAALGGLILSQTIEFALNEAKDSLAEMLTTSMLGMSVNGLDKGEDAGNALVAGSAVTLSNIAMAGGNLPLTKDAAIAYLDQQNTMIAERGKMIEATHSPFDTSTRHTFLGKIKFALIPYQMRFMSYLGMIGSIFHLAKTSLIKLLPTTKAISNQAEIANAFDFCQDPTLKSVKSDNNQEMALSPFCTPIVGLPVNYLESSYFQPQYVLDRFGLSESSKNTMWNDLKNIPIDEEEDYDISKQTSAQEFQKYFIPVDDQGACHLAFDGGNLGPYTEEETKNRCDEEYSWAIDDRMVNPPKESYKYNKRKQKWEKTYRDKIDDKINPLLEFKADCFDRTNVPFGLVDKIEDSKKETNQKWYSDLFGIDAFFAKKTTEGGRCIVSGDGSSADRLKVDFALYLMDQKVQDIFDNNNN